MGSFMIFTRIFENAYVKFVRKHVSDLIDVDGLPISAIDSIISHNPCYFGKRAATFRKERECFFYNLGNFRSNIDTSGLTVVQISVWRFARPFSAAKLLAVPTLDVLA